jgi:hypothetical protein
VDVQQVLDRNREAVQRAVRRAAVPLAVGAPGRGKRAITIDVGECVQAIVERGDAMEIRRDDLARRNRSPRAQPRELGKRQPG